MRKTIFITIMLGIIAISCEKEDSEPQGLKMLYGQTLDGEMRNINMQLAYETMIQIGDTIWPLDANGDPIKEPDPNTGELQFIGIKHYEVSVSQQLGKVSRKGTEELVKERDRTLVFFNQNPGQKVYVSFPDDAQIMDRKIETGEVFQEKIKELDNIRQQMVENPTHTLSQEIEVIHNDAKPIWLKACAEDFIDQMLNPKFAKYNPAKAQTMVKDREKINKIAQKAIEQTMKNT